MYDWTHKVILRWLTGGIYIGLFVYIQTHTFLKIVVLLMQVQTSCLPFSILALDSLYFLSFF